MSEFEWPSSPPDGFPYAPSANLRGVMFTGRYATYTGADTWYLSWASDDACYTGWTDGNISKPMEEGWDLNNLECFSGIQFPQPVNPPGMTSTGQAKIVGSDPLNLKVENLGIHHASPAPYGGRYPCGSLVHNGVWYYGTYCLDESDRKLNWDILGPFVGFRMSRDFGKTWQDTPHTPTAPIFGESGKHGGKVRIGAPHFVDFGKNMEHSPDGKAYLIAHGAQRTGAEAAWIAGDQANLVRVTPSPETINDPGAYEFFGGHDGHSQPVWTRDFTQMKPLVEWNGHLGHATMTYNAPLKKFLLVCTDGWPTVSTMDSYILESDSITGPWRLVTYMQKFGPQAYFVNIPSRFISDDGRTAWLCYSANFTNLALGTHFQPDPPGSKYAMCLQEFRLNG
jgi:hypothetical protein